MSNAFSNPGRAAQLSPAKMKLLQKRLRGEHPQPSKSLTIHRRTDEDSPAVSFSQQRLLYLDQLEPNTAVYNIPLG